MSADQQVQPGPAAAGVSRDAAVCRLRAFHLVVLAASAVVLALALILQTSGPSQVTLPGLGIALPEICTWRRLFGVSCPGCGLTRAFISLAHGDLAAAWRFNPAGIPLFACLVLQFPYRGWQLWRLGRGKGEWCSPWPTAVLAACAVLLVVQWLVRMRG